MTNIAARLERLLTPPQHAALRTASGVSQALGVPLFLVGGTVRDLLLGFTPLDIDIAMQGGGSRFVEQLAQALGAEVLSHSRFGTAKLSSPHLSLDIAMTRTETYTEPGALPEVQPGDLEQDLFRRDFSINAMAASLEPMRWGELIDRFGGQADLGDGVVRVLHDNSFRDDATRLLRAVRYSCRMSFSLEPATAHLFQRDRHYLDTIKGERVRHELERIFDEPLRYTMLRAMRDMGLLSAVFPHLTVSDQRLELADSLSSGFVTDVGRFCMALVSVEVPSHQIERLVERLHMPRKWAQTVRDLPKLRASRDRLASTDLHPSQVFDALATFDPDAIAAWGVCGDSSAIRQNARRYLETLRFVEPPLDGDDLILMGMAPGPLVGRFLRRLRDAALDGQARTRDEAARLVRHWIAEEFDTAGP